MQHLTPPLAKTVSKTLTTHGHTRQDDYYWLNERENPEVMAYLQAENAYTQALMKPLKKLEKQLFEEMKARIKQDDSSVPYQIRDYWYYSRYETGKEYPIFCRKQSSLDNEEQVVLDVNEAAKRSRYFAVMGAAISPNDQLWAFAVDKTGRRICEVRIKNLQTGEYLKDQLKDITANIVFANDNQTLFYTKQDPQTLRAHQIWKHKVGTSPKKDVLVYEEKDETFTCYITKTKSDKFLVIGCGATLSNEYHILEADKPDGAFRCFQPREREHEYSIDHAGDTFYVVTNWEAENFRLMCCGEAATAKAQWQELVPHRKEVLLEDVEVFKDFIALQERANALNHIRIMQPKTGTDYYLPMDEAAYAAYIGTNRNYDTTTLRYVYESMTTPDTTYDFDMLTQERVLKKQVEVLGGYKPEDYQAARLWATAADGTKVPVSLVYKKTTRVDDGSAPLLLYSYGSYGISEDVYFSSNRLSLLDRGFVFAVAHIRGGQDMGRYWYEQGKLLQKWNTFDDFIACARFLIAEKWTKPDKLFAMGGSAGGLLMGVVLNKAPELWKGVIAAVPFVDVVTTMLDDSIPLTTGEYDEWGNPHDKTYYDYMLSYSPYDNVKAQAYPNLLVTTGLHDSQVQYFEPAKWVAKLRQHNTSTNQILLRAEMKAGHGGKSGRFQRLKEVAMEYAWMLSLCQP